MAAPRPPEGSRATTWVRLEQVSEITFSPNFRRHGAPTASQVWLRKHRNWLRKTSFWLRNRARRWLRRIQHSPDPTLNIRHSAFDIRHSADSSVRPGPYPGPCQDFRVVPPVQPKKLRHPKSSREQNTFSPTTRSILMLCQNAPVGLLECIRGGYVVNLNLIGRQLTEAHSKTGLKVLLVRILTRINYKINQVCWYQHISLQDHTLQPVWTSRNHADSLSGVRAKSWSNLPRTRGESTPLKFCFNQIRLRNLEFLIKNRTP